MLIKEILKRYLFAKVCRKDFWLRIFFSLENLKNGLGTPNQSTPITFYFLMTVFQWHIKHENEKKNESLKFNMTHCVGKSDLMLKFVNKSILLGYLFKHTEDCGKCHLSRIIIFSKSKFLLLNKINEIRFLKWYFWFYIFFITFDKILIWKQLNNMMCYGSERLHLSAIQGS